LLHKKFKKITDIDRHSPVQPSNICQLLDPPHFSLVTTFKPSLIYFVKLNVVRQNFFVALLVNTTIFASDLLVINVADPDPGSGVFLTPGWVKYQYPG
jgi:hypothetical protein